MRRLGKGEKRNLLAALAFLGPNILGFLAFMLVPLVLSLALAFSNWDLKLHNMFREESIEFVGFSNFIRLFREEDFFKFLGNTLFFMMGIPFGIAGSLGAALLLSRELRGGNSRESRVLLIGALSASAVMVFAASVLTLAGLAQTAFVIILCGLAGAFLIGGVRGGSTVYRTLFYLPSFTSGVAVFLLWKKVYNPQNGPLNNALAGPLQVLSDVVNATPEPLVQAGLWLCFILVGLLVVFGAQKLRAMWQDGKIGVVGAAFGGLFLLVPILFMSTWSSTGRAAVLLTVVAAGAFAYAGWVARRGRLFTCAPSEGLGTSLMLAGLLAVGQFVLLGLSVVAFLLPTWAVDSLRPPNWLTNYPWAKPSIMIMGLWAAIGSNNMLLYLAGLSNVPPELYEAADIDGASGFQRFWHVTWPQLAPVTFFIVVMSMIGGLQGGFEMARTMTQGGPDGATTTLSYYIYTQGFETGRLGYASAVSWVLFAMVFVVTVFNWRFGSRYVND
jgi:multiple sugar transport system permease protein